MKKNSEMLALLSLVSHIGIMMALPIIGCLLFGNFLDQRLHTGVLFLTIFTILGVGAAFRNLFMVAMKGQKTTRKRKDSKDEERPTKS
jgi:F0F1-type ATP synthase assembly protein I